MKTITNPETIIEFVELLPTIQTQLTTTTKEIKDYLQFLHENNFIVEKNDTIEVVLEKKKNVFQSLEKIVEKRRVICKNGMDIIGQIDKLKLKIEQIVINCTEDGESFVELSNKMIDEIVSLEEEKNRKDIHLLEEMIERLKQKQSNEQNDWVKKKSDLQLELLSSSSNSILLNPSNPSHSMSSINSLNTTITPEERKQIEEWTGERLLKVLFDSRQDEWRTTKTLHERIFNQQKVICVVEDTNGNKFGGYIHTKIDRKGTTWNNGIRDEKSFLFSLKTSGKTNQMTKYPIVEREKAFLLNDNEEGMNWMFIFGSGSDIIIFKEQHKSSSQCYQSSTFDYHNTKHPLRGNAFSFTPLHFSFLQLI